jgi:hypothetical protein
MLITRIELMFTRSLILYEVIVGRAVFGPNVTMPDILHQQTKPDPVAIPVDLDGFIEDGH